MNDNREVTSKFSAADAALGYLYQCRLALLLALRRVRSGNDFCLYLEKLDDVVFDQTGKPAELLQIKHSRHRAANLTDGSPDLWKTLRIWCEGTTNNTIPQSASFYLVTTSKSGAGSAAAYLRSGKEDRDVTKAAERLRSAARSSTNLANSGGCGAFLALSPKAQAQLLTRVFILDASPTITDLDLELRNEIRWAVDREFIDPFVWRLEGWWLQRAVRQLSDSGPDPILGEEVDSQMDDLREQFKRESLPIDEDLLAEEVDASVYQEAIFVRQLNLIGIGPRRIFAAIREYFRAFTQRSRWVREDLLYVGELEKYERRLVEEWELVFERVKEELGPSATDEVKRSAAKDVYRWVEDKVIPIRRNVTHPFVTRGSYHILSDDLRVGWHPEFLVRLQHLLEERETSS